jgi:hypothetical protein
MRDKMVWLFDQKGSRFRRVPRRELTPDLIPMRNFPGAPRVFWCTPFQADVIDDLFLLFCQVLLEAVAAPSSPFAPSGSGGVVEARMAVVPLVVVWLVTARVAVLAGTLPSSLTGRGGTTLQAA